MPNELSELDTFALQVAGRFEGRYDWTDEADFDKYAGLTYKLAGALLKERDRLKAEAAAKSKEAK